MESEVFGTDSLLVEIGSVVMNAVDEKRDDLNAEEIEYITRISNRMVKEAKMQLGEIAHLLPEEIPQETVDKILRQKRGSNYGV